MVKLLLYYTFNACVKCRTNQIAVLIYETTVLGNFVSHLIDGCIPILFALNCYIKECIIFL